MEICVSIVFWLTSVCLQGPSSQALAMGSGGFLRSVSLLECSAISLFFPFLGQSFYVFFFIFVCQECFWCWPSYCWTTRSTCSTSTCSPWASMHRTCSRWALTSFHSNYFHFLTGFQQSFSQVVIRQDNDYFRPCENISSSSHWI